MIQTLIAPVANLAGSWLKGRAEKSKAKADLELAIIQNKTRLALSENEANHEWEMAQLQDKDKWLRYQLLNVYGSHRCDGCRPGTRQSDF